MQHNIAIYNIIIFYWLFRCFTFLVIILTFDGLILEKGNVQYEYDEWGSVASIYTPHNSEAENAVANINPLRYRGYYYDNETGYYYLQSRYNYSVKGAYQSKWKIYIISMKTN